MNREPEIVGGTSRALVPAQPPRFARFAGWLQRVTGLGAAPPAPQPLPPGLIGKVDSVERRIAALEEDTHKALEEAEGRILHRTQQRFETLEKELGASLRKTLERELEQRLAPLRTRLTLVALLALAAAVVAGLALYQLLASGA
jgi:hypothetical protein